MNKKNRLSSFWDKFWKDDEGRVVLAQVPNLPLMGWIVFTIMGFLVDSTAAKIFSILASLSLIIWAVLEIISGVNYFRRLLGLIIFVLSASNLIRNLIAGVF